MILTLGVTTVGYSTNFESYVVTSKRLSNCLFSENENGNLSVNQDHEIYTITCDDDLEAIRLACDLEQEWRHNIKQVQVAA